jgi:hypothetical protein
VEDEQTDLTKQGITFRNFAEATKILYIVNLSDHMTECHAPASENDWFLLTWRDIYSRQRQPRRYTG